MQDIRGAFIKINRKKMGISLEALSHAICSPSYLSKLENNEVTASEEIYQLLFKKMGLRYEVLDGSMDYWKHQLDDFFTCFFSSNLRCREIASHLLVEEELLSHSILFLYYQIFKLYSFDLVENVSNISVDLAQLTVYMNEKELFLYNLYSGSFQGHEDTSLNNEHVQIYVEKAKANKLYNEGSYLKAYDIYQNAYQMAASCANLIAMSDIALSLGFVCRFLDIKAMEHFYLLAIRLHVDDKVKVIAYYNLGVYFLKEETGREKAIKYLLEGMKLCTDHRLLEKYRRYVFVHSCIEKNIQRKHAIFEELENKQEFFEIMNTYDEYDLESTYKDCIFLHKGEDALMNFLYERNCVLNRKYKEAYYTSAKSLEFEKKLKI